MRRLKTLPRLWLVTDPRQGEALWMALERVPRGSGVLFRDRERPNHERRARYDRVRAMARRRRLVLVVAGPRSLAVAWRADGWHAGGGQRGPNGLLRTAPAHDRAELLAARRAGAALIFLSPVRATRSHPRARPLGLVKTGLLAGAVRDDLVALGGLDASDTRGLAGLRIRRWAAIDGLTPPPGQKRKAVPI